MKFAIVNYIGEEITPKSEIINVTSDEINDYLTEKSYGFSLEELYIGFICVDPVFDQFFQPRTKYTKSKKRLEYSLKVDFESFKGLTKEQARATLLKGVLDSIESAILENGIPDFDTKSYKRDLQTFFNEQNWI